MTQALAKLEAPDVMTLGTVLAKSGYFSDVRQAGQAVVKILAGQELGFGPVASMTGIYIVKGKVSLSANLIAAAVKRSGRYTYKVKSLTEADCQIEFFEGSTSLGVSTFTIQDAKTAGLAGDNWKKYPRNMLFARAVSNGAKWFTPDIFGGPIYTPDELGAEVDGETGEIIDVTPEPVKAEAQPEPDDIMEQAPKSNGRPLAAEQVRGAIHRKAGWMDGQRLVSGEPITAKQIGLVAGLIGKATRRDGMTQAVLTKARYDILSYLCGTRSTKQLTKKEASAMIDWLGGDEVGEINEWARSEAAAIIEAVGVEQGQDALVMEGEF